MVHIVLDSESESEEDMVLTPTPRALPSIWCGLPNDLICLIIRFRLNEDKKDWYEEARQFWMKKNNSHNFVPRHFSGYEMGNLPRFAMRFKENQRKWGVALRVRGVVGGKHKECMRELMACGVLDNSPWCRDTIWIQVDSQGW